MPMSTEAIIFTGVGIYLAIMLVIGIYASKRANSTADFIVSGRRMPIWICSFTLMATWFGGGTMMGASGAAHGFCTDGNHRHWHGVAAHRGTDRCGWMGSHIGTATGTYFPYDPAGTYR